MAPTYNLANATVTLAVQGASQAAATLAGATAAARAAQQAVALPLKTPGGGSGQAASVPLLPAGQSPGTTPARPLPSIPLASAPSAATPLLPAGTTPGKAPAAPGAGAGFPIPLPVFDVAVWAALKTLQGMMKPPALPPAAPLSGAAGGAGGTGGEIGKGLSAALALAQQGFGLLTSKVQGFVQAASPAHWDTLMGSINLVSATIGQAFLPVIEGAIDWIQDLAFEIKNLDPETKDSIVSLTLWGGAILGAIVIVPKLIGLGGLLFGVLGGVNAAVLMGARGVAAVSVGLVGMTTSAAGASAGFTALGVSIRAAGASMLAFVASNPITVVLALVGAVVGLSMAFGGTSESVADLASRFETLEAILERLRGGGQLTVSELRRTFRDAPGAVEALESARRGTTLAQRQALGGRLRQEAEAQLGGRPQAEVERGVNQQSNLAADLASAIRTNAPDASNMARSLVGARLGQQQGLSPEAVQQLQRGLAAGQTPEQIRAVIRQPFTELQTRIEAARRIERTGEIPGGQRQRLTDVRFQAQIGSIDTAWRRLQTAANSMTPLQQETMRIQIQSMESLLRQEGLQREIRDRLPGGPGQPGVPAIPPAGFGGGPG